MISPEVRAQIRRLFFAEHWKVGTIATELGVHHETVTTAIEAERFVNPHTRLCRSQLDLFKPFLEETLRAHPRLRATRLLEMIRARGYAGGIGILRAFVRTRCRAARAEAFVRRNVLPGEEGQVDWGSFGTLRVGNATRPLMCFVMVLSASRAVYAHFFLDARMESFLEGHVRALEAFGGTPRKVPVVVPASFFVPFVIVRSIPISASWTPWCPDQPGAHQLQERSRDRGAAARVEVPLPDDPRVRVRVEPHGLAAYDALAGGADGDDTEGRDE